MKKNLLAYITVMSSAASLCHSDANNLHLPIFFPDRLNMEHFIISGTEQSQRVGVFLLKNTVEFHRMHNSFKSFHSCCFKLTLVNT